MVVTAGQEFFHLNEDLRPPAVSIVSHQGYLSYIRGLPINDTPEIFGLHDNANISFAQNETFALLGAVARLQPRAGLAGGKTREEVRMPLTWNKGLADAVQAI